MDVAPNYGGTIVLTSSANFIVGNIEKMKSVYRERISEDPSYGNLINTLDYASEFIKKQDQEYVKDKKTNVKEFELKIGEFEKHIHDKDPEPTFQKFFNNNIVFLEPTAIKHEEKIPFGIELQPDFLIETSTEQYIVVEIETPKKRLYTKNRQPTERFTQAMTQMNDYLQWTRDNRQFLRDREWKKISAENTKGLLLIGELSQLTKEEKVSFNSLRHSVTTGYQIKTFDEILIENRTRLSNLQAYTQS